MASQRHKMYVQNYGATCYAIDEKQPAAGYIRQVPGPYVQPVGPAGGPLKGSTLAGPPPAAIPAPKFENPLLALGLILAAGQQPPEPPPEDVRAPLTEERPRGPFAIKRIEPDGDGGAWYVLDRVDIQEGDTLRAEATGSSSTNGDFEARDISNDVADETAVYWKAPTITADIVGKGRITIL